MWTETTLQVVRRGSGAALAAAGLAALSITGTVAASERGLPSSSPLVVPASAFTHYGGGPVEHQNYGYYVVWHGPGTQVLLKAPAQLPLGARVTSLWGSFQDESASDGALLSLERLDYATNTWALLGEVSSYGSAGDIHIPITSAIANPVVDPRRHTYFLRLDLREDTRLWAAGIGYEMTLIFTDGFECGDTTRWSEQVPAKGVRSEASAGGPVLGIPEPLRHRLERGGFSSAAAAVRAITSGMEAAGYGPPLVIPATDLSPRHPLHDFTFTYPGGSAVGGHPNTELVGPAYLPNGATLSSVFAVVYDNEPGSDPVAHDTRVALFRANVTNGTVESMTTMYTTGASTEIDVLYDPSPDHPVVSYPTYAYSCSTTLPGPDHRFFAMIVYYSGGP